jgi:hypothetical protein
MTDEARVLGFYVAMTTAATAFLALLRWDGLSLRALFIIGIPILMIGNILYLKARGQPKGSKPRKLFEWTVALSTIGLAAAHLFLDRH